MADCLILTCMVNDIVQNLTIILDQYDFSVVNISYAEPVVTMACLSMRMAGRDAAE